MDETARNLLQLLYDAGGCGAEGRLLAAAGLTVRTGSKAIRLLCDSDVVRRKPLIGDHLLLLTPTAGGVLGREVPLMRNPSYEVIRTADLRLQYRIRSGRRLSRDLMLATTFHKRRELDRQRIAALTVSIDDTQTYMAARRERLNRMEGQLYPPQGKIQSAKECLRGAAWEVKQSEMERSQLLTTVAAAEGDHARMVFCENRLKALGVDRDSGLSDHELTFVVLHMGQSGRALGDVILLCAELARLYDAPWRLHGWAG